MYHTQGLQNQRAFGTLTRFWRDVLLNVKRAVSTQLTTKNIENLCGSEVLRREYFGVSCQSSISKVQ